LTTTNKDFKVKHGLSVSGGATFGQAIEIAEPTADDHAATKGYVDTAISDKADLVNGTVSPDQLSTINEAVTLPRYVSLGLSTSAYSNDGINWQAGTPVESVSNGSITGAYGNGKFVALSYIYPSGESIASYSSDGVSWAETSIGITLPIYKYWDRKSLAYGNGKFVAVANGTSIGAYSSDGINWTETSLPSVQSWAAVTYGNGLFVAIARNLPDNPVSPNTNVAAYSSDGINWTQSELPSLDAWRSVAYGDGIFVAVGSNAATNIAAQSSDGINWQQVTMPESKDWVSVAYGNGKFVAITSNNSTTGAYSSDGINWTTMTLAKAYNWQTVSYGSLGFIVTGRTGVSSTEAMHSVDGVSWTQTTMPESARWETDFYGEYEGIQDFPIASQKDLDSAITTHNSDTTNVHGIANTADLATKSYADTAAANAVAGLVDSAPGALDTLNELAAALGDDENFATTVTTALGTKAPIADPTFTGEVTVNSLKSPDGTTVFDSDFAGDDLKRINVDLVAVGFGTGQTRINEDTVESSNVETDVIRGRYNSQSEVYLGDDSTTDNVIATKGYVDSLVGTTGGDSPKIFAVTVSTTGPIDISADTAASDIIDGVTLLADDTILVKDQELATENGIYFVNESGPATRLSSYDNVSKIHAGDIFYVENGDINEDSSYILSNIVTTLDTDPLLIIPAFGPNFITVSNGLSIEDSPTGKVISIAANPTLEDLELDNLTVNQGSILAEVEVDTLTVNQESVFLGEVTVPEPTNPTNPATKEYVDELLNQESVEITTIDDLSNYFNGYNSRFLPTYKGLPVTLQNPFNLLLTIDGIIQSVGSPDYVWQSVMPRVGFRIDNDGYIAFPEAIPVGSSFDARVLVGSAITTQTKVYPFKAMDIVLGGY
jgi:hypothetical protein